MGREPRVALQSSARGGMSRLVVLPESFDAFHQNVAVEISDHDIMRKEIEEQLQVTGSVRRNLGIYEI
jgi:hypothetical protein